MSKVITFSRFFPSYHTRACEPTYFVEKIHNSILGDNGSIPFELDEQLQLIETNEFKHHTIRAGNRFKAGDWFSPRVWSGKPYNSKQIVIAPDIQVKKIFPLEIYYPEPGFVAFSIDSIVIPVMDIAKNDGLNEEDLISWFKGAEENSEYQIICWNENIEY